jgi:integrase
VVAGAGSKNDLQATPALALAVVCVLLLQKLLLLFMAKHKITDTSLRQIRDGDSRQRIADGEGLYLLLFVKGGAHGWRLDYTFNARRKTISLGTYPDTTLALARTKAEKAKALIASGIDPSTRRQEEKAEIALKREVELRSRDGLPLLDSFEDSARNWYSVRKGDWASSYGEKIIRRFEVDIFPYLGKHPIGSITPPQLLEVLRRIEKRGVIETAHRALENCSQVFRFAIAEGKALSNPARDLKDALRKPTPKHFPAITEPKRLGELLRAIDSYRGTPVVRAALQLHPMLLLRPGELRAIGWDELDLTKALLTVPAARMKREKAGKLHGAPHTVPLSHQAVAIFSDLRPLTGDGKFVFRGERHHDRPMSDAAMNAALAAMGFPSSELTPHGFRATARTMLAEVLGEEIPVIEAQLAHAVQDSLGRAYNRTQYEAQRRKMLQRWADYLDELRKAV